MVYGPFVLVSGVLLAEGLLLALQALALYLLLRGITDERAEGVPLLGRLATGLLMLRPAFQYAGPLLGPWLARGAALAQGAGLGGTAALACAVRRRGAAGGRALGAAERAGLRELHLVAHRRRLAAGLLGHLPPQPGVVAPDSSVPPSSGWRASRGRGGRDGDRDARPGLPGSGGVAGAVHPLQALATEAHKLYRGYLHPFNTYAEAPSGCGALAQPLHRALVFLTLGAGRGLGRGVAGAGLSILLGTALLATGLPFLASHIDVRYTVPLARCGDDLRRAGHG